MWSVEASGEPDYVRNVAVQKFDNTPVFPEPEETLRQKARDLILYALAANQNKTVSLEAKGYQTSYVENNKTQLTNSVYICIS